TIAAGGVLGSFLGPWSAGSSAVLLWLGAGERHPLGRGWFAQGGMGAIADALASAARAAGVTIRLAADVRQILVNDESATSVVLETGEEIATLALVSSADPKRTLRQFVDPMHLTPEFLQQLTNVRTRGTLAKINYAVSSLPEFNGLSVS